MNTKINRKNEPEIDSPEYNSKSKRIYMIKSILGFFAGILLGIVGMMLVFYFKENSINPLKTLAELYPNIQVHVVPWLILTLMIICVILGEYYIKKGKQLIITWDGEDDDHIRAADSYLNKVILITNIHTITMLILFALATYHMLNAFEKAQSTWQTILAIIVYFISLFVSISQQSRCVKLNKEYAPEKQGSIYDKKFHDVWYASCDEAERQLVGEASRKTYQFMSKVISFTFLFTMVIGMFIPIGVLCSFFIGLLWLIMTCYYTCTCMKLENKK